MLSPSDKNEANVVEAFNSTSRYLDVLLNIDKLINKSLLKAKNGRSDISQ